MTPRSKPYSCQGCKCAPHGTDFSQIEGSGSLGVMLVGEASGEHEQRDELPFRPYAPAGGVLERVLRRMSLDRQQTSITNVLRCRPKNNWLEKSPWEHAAISHCQPNLVQAIAERKPRAIVALGGIPSRELTGLSGDKLGVGHLTGYVLPLQAHLGADTPVVVNWHPAHLRRGKISYMGAFARVLQRAVNIAKGRDQQWLWNIDPGDQCTWGPLRYQVRPSLDDAESFYLMLRDNQGLRVSKDIETPESADMDEDAREGFLNTDVRQIQFSVGKHQGIALPWRSPFKEVAAKILNLPHLSYGHNWEIYDHRVLRACALREGWQYAPTCRMLDTLDMFHHWQPDLPAHLQFAASFVQFPFPWKHMHTLEHEPFYGCCDTDATWQVGEMLQETLRRDDTWGDSTRGYIGQVYEVRPVLSGMEERGLPVDDAVRLGLGDEFRKAQDELAQELIGRYPESAKKLDPYKPNKMGELVLPPELRTLPETAWGQLFRDPDKWKCRCGRDNIKMEAQECPKCGKSQDDGSVKAGKWYRYAIRQVPVAVIGTDGEPTTELAERWCWIPEYNPNSAQMLIEYMKSKGHKVPKSKEEDEDGNQKDTTNKKELVRLAKKHGDDFYLKTIEYREYGKMKGTYVDGFKPHADGCSHSTFTFDTAIAQLAARNPNCVNIPKHGRLAKAIRRMFAAKPGNILTEWDFKSCHVLTLGYLANDPNYIRTARIDQHSIMTGHFLKLWRVQDILKESDDEIKARCKWLKSNAEWKHIRDAKVKHAGLGIGNGLKEKGLYERYMEFFASQKEARNILACYEEVYPMVFAWQKRMQRLAHEQTWLKTEYGHIRRFYEVFRWDSRKGDWGHGDQAEAAISFWLSNIAFGYIREKLKELHRLGLDEKYGLCNNVHDSFLFHFPETLLAEHLREVQPVLVAPSPVLRGPAAPNGLWIAVDCAVGHDWSAMEEVKLPKVVEGHVVLEQEAMA